MMGGQCSEYAESSCSCLCMCDVYKAGVKFLHQSTNLEKKNEIESLVF